MKTEQHGGAQAGSVRRVTEVAKREMILQAARALFVERGYKGTSMDDVAERADVGKGTLYLVSESKADLFYQVVEADLQAWARAISAFVDPKRPAPENLRQMAVHGALHLAEHPLTRDLFSGAHQGVLPRWVDRFQALRVRGRAIVVAALRLGIERGEINPSLDVEAVAAVIQDCTHASYTLYGEAWAADTTLATQRIEARVNLWLDGLLPRASGA